MELVHPKQRTARTEDVKEVIKVLQNSPTAAYLRDCTLHERIMLASLSKCMKREGVEEIKWGEVCFVFFWWDAQLTVHRLKTSISSMSTL